MPATVTWRSAIASSSADCVFGVARLISSASRTCAKIGPCANDQLAVAVLLEEHARAGDVGRHQIDGELDPVEGEVERLPSVRTSSVLPVPGTPSISTWPPAKRAMRISSTTSAWPTITLPSSARSVAKTSRNSSTRVRGATGVGDGRRRRSLRRAPCARAGCGCRERACGRPGRSRPARRSVPRSAPRRRGIGAVRGAVGHSRVKIRRTMPSCSGPTSSCCMVTSASCSSAREGSGPVARLALADAAGAFLVGLLRLGLARRDAGDRRQLDRHRLRLASGLLRRAGGTEDAVRAAGASAAARAAAARALLRLAGVRAGRDRLALG